MGQRARHVGGCYKYRYFVANICLHRSVILVLHFLTAAPSLEAARYRACASRRACIRSAHVLMAAPSLEAARYRACASRRACIRSAAGTASSAISKMANLQTPPLPRRGVRVFRPSAPIRNGTISGHLSKIAFSDAIPVCFVDPAWRKGLIASRFKTSVKLGGGRLWSSLYCYRSWLHC